jgi:hypothetical protein
VIIVLPKKENKKPTPKELAAFRELNELRKAGASLLTNDWRNFLDSKQVEVFNLAIRIASMGLRFMFCRFMCQRPTSSRVKLSRIKLHHFTYTFEGFLVRNDKNTGSGGVALIIAFQLL